MNKLKREVLLFISGFFICFIWVYRGYKMGEKENEIERNTFYCGKVIDAYVPETAKFLVIELANHTKYTLDYMGLRDMVKVGDSIKKEKGSFKFIIFKESNPHDSVIFIGTNFYTK